jgi:hypothetical protein
MIDQIFSILNFLIFIGFCIYVFRRYAAEQLRSYITMDQITLNNMQRKYEQLVKQEQSLVRAGQHQYETYHDLSRKVAAWTAALHHQHNVRAREQVHIQAHIDERLQVQKVHLEQRAICQKVLPQAIERATEQLLDQFKSKQHSDSYIEHIVSILPPAVNR